jgi:hypothetical protein
VCTVILLWQPHTEWPLLLAANRDEQLARPWDMPGAHWPEHPGVIAGRDRTGGGTWMGLNRHGVVAAVLNRPGSLGPAPGKRSRGEIPLIALSHSSATAAAGAVSALDARQWRSFNLVLADARGAIFVRGLGHGHPESRPLPPGLSMITAHDPNDLESPRVARHLPRFHTAPPPRPDREPSGWKTWQQLLADSGGAAAEQINVVPRGGFGTVCSSLLAIPAIGRPIWLFAAGPPHEVPFVPVALSD